MPLRKIAAALASLAIAASMFGASAAPVAAVGQDGSWIKIWEDFTPAGFLNGDNALVYKVDTGNIPNLSNFNLGIFLGCDAGTGNWNNCITAVQYNLKGGTCVRFYDSTSYTGTLLKEYKNTAADGSSMSTLTATWRGTTIDNRTTSIRWGNYDHYQGKCVMGNY